MTPVAELVRFFCDESALGVGKTLAAARKDVIHTGHPLIPDVPLGTLDTTWMPLVAKRGLVVIARDRRIKSKPAELALLREAGLRVFWIAGKNDLSTWDYLSWLVRYWDTIEETIAVRGAGPWFMAINSTGVKEIALP